MNTLAYSHSLQGMTTLTESHNFSPVPPSYVIVDSVLSRPSTHLPRAHTQWIEECPKSLDSLSIRPGRPFDKV